MPYITHLKLKHQKKFILKLKSPELVKICPFLYYEGAIISSFASKIYLVVERKIRLSNGVTLIKCIVYLSNLLDLPPKTVLPDMAARISG